MRRNALIALTAAAATVLTASVAAYTMLSRPAPHKPIVQWHLTDPRVPVTRTTSWQWHDFQGIQLPTSPVAGPMLTTNGVASGFTHTPEGALLAALNISVRADGYAGPDVYWATITFQVSGEGHELMASQEQIYNRWRGDTPYGKPLLRPHVHYLGYRWQDYDDTEASLDVLRSDPPGIGEDKPELWSIHLKVRWLAGDWMLVPPPDGSWDMALSGTTSDADFTRFGGQGAGL